MKKKTKEEGKWETKTPVLLLILFTLANVVSNKINQLPGIETKLGRILSSQKLPPWGQDLVSKLTVWSQLLRNCILERQGKGLGLTAPDFFLNSSIWIRTHLWWGVIKNVERPGVYTCRLASHRKTEQNRKYQDSGKSVSS